MSSKSITVFSSDSSDEGNHRYAKSGASGSESTKRVMRLNIHSQNEKMVSPPVQSGDAPEGFRQIDKTQISKIAHNSIIQYENMKGKLVKSKYFKKCDPIESSILLGFYTHDKRNYSEQLSNIKKMYILNSCVGGGKDMLKETIEIPENQWKTIRRDTIISYQKKDNDFVYKAKFNTFSKASDGTSRMRLTSETGFNFTANPANIKKIYRHVTGNDKTLSFILETLRKLEARVKQLEQK